ncbi:MAG: Arm DNA-binding domain-containing protein [Parvibaculum sp.]|nr:Arm DNA-binding domain-containing protein [Parvibaculum sp.]
MKLREKLFKVADSNGLHLYVAPAGSKPFRYRYEFGGREKVLTIGAYPGVEARSGRDAARHLRDQPVSVRVPGRR